MLVVGALLLGLGLAALLSLLRHPDRDQHGGGVVFLVLRPLSPHARRAALITMCGGLAVIGTVIVIASFA